jgi:hypothetical protein
MVGAPAGSGPGLGRLQSLEYGLEMRVVLDRVIEEPGLDVRTERRTVGVGHGIDALGDFCDALHERAMLGDMVLDRRIRDGAEMTRCFVPPGAGTSRLALELPQYGILGSQMRPCRVLYDLEAVDELRQVLACLHRGAKPCDQLHQMSMLAIKPVVTDGKQIAPDE